SSPETPEDGPGRSSPGSASRSSSCDAAVMGTPAGSGGPGLVTDTANGHDDLGVLRVLLDLGAQALHVDVDQAGVRGVAVPPELLQQDLAREDLAGLARQRDQQVELQRGEADLFAVAAH